MRYAESHMTDNTTAILDRSPGMLDEQSRPPSKSAKWLVLVAAFLGWMFDGLEMGIMPQIARPALNNLLKPIESFAVLDTAGRENVIKWWHQVIDAGFLFGA